MTRPTISSFFTEAPQARVPNAREGHDLIGMGYEATESAEDGR